MYTHKITGQRGEGMDLGDSMTDGGGANVKLWYKCRVISLERLRELTMASLPPLSLHDLLPSQNPLSASRGACPRHFYPYMNKKAPIHHVPVSIFQLSSLREFFPDSPLKHFWELSWLHFYCCD